MYNKNKIGLAHFGTLCAKCLDAPVTWCTVTVYVEVNTKYTCITQ